MRTSLITSFFIILLTAFYFSAFALLEGFYKDVFQDEGTQIGGGDLEIDCEYINFTQEHLDAGDNDQTEQAKIMIENENDDNGYLLYPDGDPRFAIIYYHGGYMNHSDDLGVEGRQRVRDHYYHGGSQFGSCAGSYMLSTYWDDGELQSTWFQIWPGEMNGPNVSSTNIDKIINANSPFIGYNDYKEGDIIPSVFHQRGGSVDTTTYPKGTEFCAMHNGSSLKGYAAIWTWKDNDTTGRVLGHTGHPEGSESEEKIKYISASMLLIADGLGRPDIKHELVNGTEIVMDRETGDDDPLNTKIGDKQYHHFIIVLENPGKNVTITLDGEDDYDFHLFAAQDTFAFNHSADYADSSDGADKTLAIDDAVPACTLFVGVKLNTTVTTSNGDIFPEYGGDLEVLNGISYTVNATWDGTDITALNQIGTGDQFSVKQLGRNMRIAIGKIQPKSLRIYDTRGRLCWKPTLSKEMKQYTWQPTSAGLYLIRANYGKKKMLTQRITIVK